MPPEIRDVWKAGGARSTLDLLGVGSGVRVPDLVDEVAGGGGYVSRRVRPCHQVVQSVSALWPGGL